MGLIEVVTFENTHEARMAEAFPDVASGKRPCGWRVQCQLRKVKERTRSGIELVQETKETEKFNTTVAKVIKMGPLAYRDRKTMDLWPEGAWCQVGDYVTVPRWGGERWERKIPGTSDAHGREELTYFVEVNDGEIIDVIEDDPLSFRAFVD